MSLREEFVQLALQAGVNRRELCRRFGIAPKTGYKWLMRYARAGASSCRGSLEAAPAQSCTHRG